MLDEPVFKLVLHIPHAAENDETAAEESDTRDDGRGDKSRLNVRKPQERDIYIVAYDHEKTRAQRDETEGARAGGLARKYRAFGTDDAAEDYCKHEFEKHDARRVDKLRCSLHTGIIRSN